MTSAKNITIHSLLLAAVWLCLGIGQVGAQEKKTMKQLERELNVALGVKTTQPQTKTELAIKKKLEQQKIETEEAAEKFKTLAPIYVDKIKDAFDAYKAEVTNENIKKLLSETKTLLGKHPTPRSKKAVDDIEKKINALQLPATYITLKTQYSKTESPHPMLKQYLDLLTEENIKKGTLKAEDGLELEIKPSEQAFIDHVLRLSFTQQKQLFRTTDKLATFTFRFDIAVYSKINKTIEKMTTYTIKVDPYFKTSLDKKANTFSYKIREITCEEVTQWSKKGVPIKTITTKDMVKHLGIRGTDVFVVSTQTDNPTVCLKKQSDGSYTDFGRWWYFLRKTRFWNWFK